jgi:type IX secretion system PorP/SprF family membrane protein
MKHFLLLTVMLSSIAAYAQYIPNSNQAYQYSSVYNPAFSGIENFSDLKLGYRYQWTAYGTDAPRFVNLVYNDRLNNPAAWVRNSFRGSTPARLPKSKRIIHGISANVYNEDVGVVNRWGGGVGYGIHYPISEKNVWLAAGASVLFDATQIDTEEIYLGANPDPDPYYDQLIANGVNQTDLNVRAGILVYSPLFYVGLSYLPVWNKSLENSEIQLSTNYYRATFQAGVSVPLGESFHLKPSIAGVLQQDDQVHVDYSIKTYYREKIWLGFSYRDVESGVGLIGFRFNNLLSVTYSYEVPTVALEQFSNGSHELVLALRLNNSEGYNQFVW